MLRFHFRWRDNEPSDRIIKTGTLHIGFSDELTGRLFQHYVDDHPRSGVVYDFGDWSYSEPVCRPQLSKALT